MKRVLLLAAVLVALSAAPAYAHVTVSAPGATPGGSDQLITFRVPVEKDVPTVGVTVQLPTATPIASVLVLPVPGWTHTEVTSKLAKPIVTDDGDITSAVTRITWTATAGGLKRGEFGEFTLIAGKLPDTTSLTFAAIQKYRDGSTVSWNQTAAPGAPEPDNPAPTLQLTASSKPVASSSSGGGSDTGPVVLSIIAIVVAAAALGLVVVGRARRRS